MNERVCERLKALRKIMEERGVQHYYITTADYHNSEYADDYFKEREFMSGFTGSNGNLLIESEKAGLWTDGRYFIQAEKELEGSEITLFRMAEEGVPTVTEYLEQNIQEGEILAFDGRTVAARLGRQMEAILEKKKGKVLYHLDFVDEIWTDRPSRKCNEVFALDEKICGKTVAQKLDMVRVAMSKKNCKNLVLSKMDDIMWLFNIRGKDVKCNPVALSYAIITEDNSYLFLQENAVTEKLKDWIAKQPVTLCDYERIMEFLQNQTWNGAVLLDNENISYAIYKLVKDSAEVVWGDNPTELLKSMKNEVELEMMREVYLKDSLVVCRFMKWMKENIGKIPMSELSAAEYMDNLRRETEGFLDLSFPTICGYKENAAMMHYQATEDNYKELEAESMLLIDCGGQYLGGTTDVTRTFALGPVTEVMKEHFTAVAMGMLRLLNGKFLYGCTGRNLDILARGPLWDRNIDYKCGTGHGIGYILNVHEGPQNVRWRFLEGMKEVPLEEGMVLSNEPGVYIEGSHGIRTENIMVTKRGEKNGDGQFMHFESLTFVPIDLDLIDTSIMEKKDIENLNRYHKEVYEKIAPLMTEEEASWLKEVTREVK
ncbi:MAG: aminopeptidase P family protein [Lachnospiraceae bacterium]|nr:aminopeptidase P family protein [Lachnospiraceae bacterium]